MTAIHPCTIYCSSDTSILVINVVNFELHNINLINCGKNHTIFILKQENYSSMRFRDNNNNSSMLFYHCKVVRITCTNILVSSHFSGVLAMNVMHAYCNGLETFFRHYPFIKGVATVLRDYQIRIKLTEW